MKIELNSCQKGKLAEEKAVQFLKNQNFVIIDRNFYTRFGEIDIIAKKDGVLHFVEVKSGENFNSIYNVTFKKVQRIIKTINIYLNRKGDNSPYQIDVITINSNRVEYIKNISLF